MSARGEILERPGDGLVLLLYTDALRGISDVALWSRVRLRKHCRCALTGVELHPGDQAYAPVGNQLYRMQRIAAALVEGS